MQKDEKWVEFDKAVLEGRATWWQMELPSGDVFFGDAKTDMLGYKSENFNKYQDFTGLIHEDDYEKAMQNMRDHLEGKKNVYETIYRIKCKSGDYIKFYDIGKIIQKEESKTLVAGFVLKVDNTEKKEEQKKQFKKMVVEEKPSLIDTLSKMKNQL
jgi:PAS domain S-box-containing protein